MQNVAVILVLVLHCRTFDFQFCLSREIKREPFLRSVVHAPSLCWEGLSATASSFVFICLYLALLHWPSLPADGARSGRAGGGGGGLEWVVVVLDLSLKAGMLGRRVFRAWS